MNKISKNSITVKYILLYPITLKHIFKDSPIE